MSRHQKLAATILAAFKLDADPSQPEAIADTAAALLIEIADVLRGPAPVVGELASTELLADETMALILILTELRKHTTLLEVLAKQGDRALHVDINNTPYGIARAAANVATGAAASGLPG